MHVGRRLGPVDGVFANGGADGTAGGAAVGGPELQRGGVAVDAQHGRAARRDGPCAPSASAAKGVYDAHRLSRAHTVPYNVPRPSKELFIQLCAGPEST